MAINYRVQENGETVHFETGASVTLTSNGSNVQTELENTQNSLKKIPSPNLLINTDFTNPVNQRRATTLTVDKYFVDRWYKISGVPTALTISSTYGLNIKFLSIGQYIEFPNSVGKTISASAKFCDGEGKELVITLTDTMTSSGISNGCFALNPDYNGVTGTLHFLIKNFLPPSTWGFGTNGLYLLWAKVEVSDVPTAYSYPLYADELLRCQRYYLRYSSDNGAVLYPSMAYYMKEINVPIYPPVEMRITPTVSYSGEPWFAEQNGNGSTGYTVTAFSTNKQVPGKFSLNATVNRNVTGFSQWNLIIPGNQYIDFDAEYYA